MNNREILFRAIAIHGNEWVFGNYIHSKRMSGRSCEYRIVDKDTGMESDIIPETLGQFINATDQHKEMLFVGDRIRFDDYSNNPNEVFTIVFYRGTYCAESENTNVSQQERVHFNWQNFCRINQQPYIPIKVGTIHDHLLKGE